MKAITLNWTPLQHYSFLAKLDNCLTENRSGIYIWGFKDDGGLFWPYYVGKHKDIPFRLCEHLSSLLGGLYQVYTIAELFNDPRGDSYYSKDSIHKWISQIKNNTIQPDPHSSEMIKRFHFTYTLLEDFANEGADAEKFILNSIKQNILVNKRFGEPKEDKYLFYRGNLFQVINPKWESIKK